MLENPGSFNDRDKGRYSYLHNPTDVQMLQSIDSTSINSGYQNFTSQDKNLGLSTGGRMAAWKQNLPYHHRQHNFHGNHNSWKHNVSWHLVTHQVVQSWQANPTKWWPPGEIIQVSWACRYVEYPNLRRKYHHSPHTAVWNQASNGKLHILQLVNSNHTTHWMCNLFISTKYVHMILFNLEIKYEILVWNFIVWVH